MTQRKLSVALIAGLLCLVAMAREAGATVTIALEWGNCGGGVGGCTVISPSEIAATPGQTLRLDVFLSHTLTQGLEYYAFSLNFDTALDNELDLGPMAQVEWSGTDVHPGPNVYSYAPLKLGVTTHDSTGASAGRINSFESAGFVGVLPANGLAYSVGTHTATAPARYRVGQAFFAVTGYPPTDGADIFSGLFNLPESFLDGFLDGNHNTVAPGTIVFGAASVNSGEIPEPGTVSLLGLGLVCLVLAKRSRRS